MDSASSEIWNFVLAAKYNGMVQWYINNGHQSYE